MDVDKLFEFLDRSKKEKFNGLPLDLKYYSRRAMIMGGEPTLHPRLRDVVERMQSEVPQVTVFTNGLKLDWLDWYKPRTMDNIIYNGYAFNYSDEALAAVMRHEKHTVFHLVVAEGQGEAVLAKIKLLKEVSEEIRITLSPDMMINLDERPDYVDYWEDIYAKALAIRPTLIVDHPFPKCIKSSTTKVGCGFESHMGNLRSRTSCMGLINAQFEVFHCNNSPIKLGYLFKDEKPITTQELYEIYEKGREHKIELMKQRDGCANCPRLAECVGGCYRSKHIKIKPMCD